MSEQQPKRIPTPAEMRAAGLVFDEDLQRWVRPRARRVVHDLGQLAGAVCDPDLIPHLPREDDR